MKPRFQADNDLRSSILTGVLRREASVDFKSALLARLDGVSDPEVLRLACQDDRILVTHDENRMPAHFAEFIRAGNSSPRVLVVPQGTSVGQVIESILAIWIASDSSEWRDGNHWLPF